jgi:monothiol glutaredoxin
MEEIQKQIETLVKSKPIVLFMKGNPEAPQCGFSAQTIRCLESLGATVTTVDVLQDSAVRQGIKDYTQWPTIPQLFISGEFVGGCDIVTELFEKGELKKAVDEAMKK